MQLYNKDESKKRADHHLLWRSALYLYIYLFGNQGVYSSSTKEPFRPLIYVAK